MVHKLFTEFNRSMESNINQYLNMYVVNNNYIQEYTSSKRPWKSKAFLITRKFCKNYLARISINCFVASSEEILLQTAYSLAKRPKACS